ncbi:MAG: hypothetical protein SFX18_14165 [Pirellulales bacterium]|nr:hypothetical protein [Pirellulales bacterium]
MLDWLIALAILTGMAGVGPLRGYRLDSPWFYLALLAGMAYLGIVIIEGKFNIRQQRIELKAHGRELAQEQINRGQAIDPHGRRPTVVNPPVDAAPSSASAPPPEKSLPSPASGNAPETADFARYENFVTQENAKTLTFLKWLMALAALTGIAGFWWQGRSLAEGPVPVPGEPKNPAPPPI